MNMHLDLNILTNIIQLQVSKLLKSGDADESLIDSCILKNIIAF